MLAGPRIFGGAALFRVNTTSNYLYILEGSTDLLYWLPLSTNLANGVNLDLTDPNYPGSGRRFYRMRVEE